MKSTASARLALWSCLALALPPALAIAGCGDSSSGGGSLASKAAAYCSAFCGKSEECGILPTGTTRSQCESTCRTNTTTSSPCEPSQSAIDACVSALTSASCAAVLSGEDVDACVALCPDDQGDATTGSDTVADTNSPSDGFNFDTTGATSQACMDLGACCPSLSEQQKTSCEATVNLGQADGCDSLLELFKSLGNCN